MRSSPSCFTTHGWTGKVLFFHDQDITADEQMAFALQYGEIDRHPYLEAHEQQDMAVIDNAAAPESRSPWHTDATFRDCPPFASFLLAKVLPPAGGDTCFANMELVYEGLSDGVKEVIDGRTATHSVRKNFARHLSGAELDAELERFPEQHHPIVRTHPVTGRKGLFVSASFVDHIDGLEADEGANLLQHLISETHRVEYQMRFRWQVNSLAMWDNRCTQHAPGVRLRPPSPPGRTRHTCRRSARLVRTLVPSQQSRGGLDGDADFLRIDEPFEFMASDLPTVVGSR